MPQATSNYPYGFPGGMITQGVPISPVHRKVYYVGNHPTLLKGEITAADGNDGSFYKPWSSIDNAFSFVKAGDIVYVRPQHAVTVSAAAGIAIDVAGISVIGMGVGEDRPIITFATSTAATVTLSANDIHIANLIFKCNIASQTKMIAVSGTDCIIDSCEFREGTQTGLNFITLGTLDNDSDRSIIRNCRFYAPTAGNMDSAISLAKDFRRVQIADCSIYGDFDQGAIEVPTGGNAQIGLEILRCRVTNLLTNIAAISINGTGSDGIIKDCVLMTDTLASALDNGSLATDNVSWASISTDQVSSTPVFVPVDSASNILGADNSNNAFASTSVAANADGSIIERLEYIQTSVAVDSTHNYIGVDGANNLADTSAIVANRDGSVLERLEYLMDPLGDYNTGLGIRITKSGNLADGAGTDNLFTITGAILVNLLVGQVTTGVGGAATLKLTCDSDDICAATTIDSDVTGTTYWLSGIFSETLNGGVTPTTYTAGLATGGIGRVILGTFSGGAVTLAHVLDAADTGNILWTMYYVPLTASATVTAAA